MRQIARPTRPCRHRYGEEEDEDGEEKEDCGSGREEDDSGRAGGPDGRDGDQPLGRSPGQPSPACTGMMVVINKK